MTATAEIIAPSVRIVPPELDESTHLFDLLLRGQTRLSQLLVDEAFLPGAVQQLTLLSIAGFAVHGLVVGAAMYWASHGATGLGAVLAMPFAFSAAFLGALCICLPSFYFYTQLAGFDASFRLVTAQALRTNATTSVLLLGTAPFFAAYSLACGLGLVEGGAESVYKVGFALPFAVGLLGLRALYRSFSDLSTALPQKHVRRGNVLRRMILCWGGVYAVIAPVALERLIGRFPLFIALYVARHF